MTLSRRSFLTTSTAAALTPVASEVLAKKPAPASSKGPAQGAGARGATNYQFFNAPEAAFIEAAVDRLIPPDAIGPGAVEADVPGYIDKQLAGAWGAGERLYRSGPWQPGTPMQGYQLPFTPAELFRTALRGIRNDLMTSRNSSFERLSGTERDAYLTLLQTSAHDLEGVPGNVFFESLWGMTVEGYFSDPVYGGNRDMAAWKMIGFPGAYGGYYELVDRHGERFVGAPRSLAQSGRGVIRIMPEIPAGPGQLAMPPGMSMGGKS
jgi:gluconate 2-dehydrogenase gamma chain